MGEQVVERSVSIRLASKGIDGHAVARRHFGLDHRAGWHTTSIQYRRHSDHAFTADRGHLDHPAILQYRQDRAEATCAGEVDVLKRFAGFVKDVFELERDDVERRSETLVILGRQRSEQKILRIRRRWPIPCRRRRSIGRGAGSRTALGAHSNLE